ncbi:hypothetical protein [Actinomadura keratinilytica]|jgi:hypothetical protein|uniref:Uncharacterized protein n=1 Tax=Actinomadura keratinilytica TaxID=547461 RepID=A0ABP7ZHM7_9ACTN
MAPLTLDATELAGDRSEAAEEEFVLDMRVRGWPVAREGAQKLRRRHSQMSLE